MLAPALITILAADTALTAAIEDRIYPIIDIPEVPVNATLSAIYYSVGMFPEDIKTGQAAANHTVSILVVTNGYLSSWQLSLKLRKALEKKTGLISGIIITSNRCQSIVDEYEFTPQGMYGQKLTFQIRTAPY